MARDFGRSFAFLGGAALATTTGTTVTTTPVFDLTGYTGAFALVTGAVTSTANGLVARSGTASGSLSDLAGTYTTCHTAAVLLEIDQPHAGPYVDFVLRQGTSGRHGGISVWGVGPRAMPTTHAAGLTYKHVAHPGSGTATSS
jgi:hypothetical protein